VRRPPAYYRHLLAAELAPPPPEDSRLGPCLAANAACWDAWAGGDGGGGGEARLAVLGGDSTDARKGGGGAAAAEASCGEQGEEPRSSSTTTSTATSASTTSTSRNLRLSAAVRAMVPLLPEDYAYGDPFDFARDSTAQGDAAAALEAGAGKAGTGSGASAGAGPGTEGALVAGDAALREAHFPTGVLDHNGSQLDLRPTNSWRLPIDQVPRRGDAKGARRLGGSEGTL